MKKLGKILLFGAAVGTAAAAAYHYFQKTEKERETNMVETEEDTALSNEDDSFFDDEDFDNDLDITALQEEEENYEADFSDPTPDTDIEDMATVSGASSFSPLSETLMQEEDVEEFFDEDADETTEE